MSKPRAIRWLEQETGTEIDWDTAALPPAPHAVAVRLAPELAVELRELATRQQLSLDAFVVLRAHVEHCRP